MQATEAVGCERHMDVSIRENGTGEMQDVLSRYLSRFYRSAYRQLGNAADAEDAVQDALLAAYKHLDQFKGQAQMSTWLTSIVRIVRGCNCGDGHANATRRWMNRLGKIRIVACQIVWRIPDQVPKTNVGSRNCTRVFYNPQSSSRPRCAEHQLVT